MTTLRFETVRELREAIKHLNALYLKFDIYAHGYWVDQSGECIYLTYSSAKVDPRSIGTVWVTAFDIDGEGPTPMKIDTEFGPDYTHSTYLEVKIIGVDTQKKGLDKFFADLKK